MSGTDDISRLTLRRDLLSQLVRKAERFAQAIDDGDDAAALAAMNERGEAVDRLVAMGEMESAPVSQRGGDLLEEIEALLKRVTAIDEAAEVKIRKAIGDVTGEFASLHGRRKMAVGYGKTNQKEMFARYFSRKL
jgi:hypothetical protein